MLFRNQSTSNKWLQKPTHAETTTGFLLIVVMHNRHGVKSDFLLIPESVIVHPGRICNEEAGGL